MFNETYKLSNGVEIPKLGLGTWLLDDKQAAQAVRDAVSIGYRHIDTAQAYMNEVGVGKESVPAVSQEKNFSLRQRLLQKQRTMMQLRSPLMSLYQK